MSAMSLTVLSEGEILLYQQTFDLLETVDVKI